MLYRSAISVARFDISGRYVFAGTTNGMLLVFNTRTKTVRYLFFNVCKSDFINFFYW